MWTSKIWMGSSPGKGIFFSSLLEKTYPTFNQHLKSGGPCPVKYFWTLHISNDSNEFDMYNIFCVLLSQRSFSRIRFDRTRGFRVGIRFGTVSHNCVLRFGSLQPRINQAKKVLESSWLSSLWIERTSRSFRVSSSIAFTHDINTTGAIL